MFNMADQLTKRIKGETRSVIHFLWLDGTKATEAYVRMIFR
jgi:hypothetical protein